MPCLLILHLYKSASGFSFYLNNFLTDKQYLGRLTKSIPGDEPKQESIFKQGMMSFLGRLNKSISEDKVYKQGMVSILLFIVMSG